MCNKKSNQKFNEDDNHITYLEKLKESQEHLFNPFHYTGGKVPLSITHPGRPVLLGWSLIISAIVFGGCHTFVVIPFLGLENLSGIIVTSIFMYGLAMLQIIGGIRLIKKANEKYFTNILQSKKFTIISSIILTIVISLSIVYNYNRVVSEKVITSAGQYTLEQINYENFIYLNEITVTLKCSYDDYRKLWEKQVSNELFKKDVFKDTKYILVYKWNKLKPQKGKLLEIKEVKIK